ncbi:MAG: hypothetical protein Q9187_005764 [Circinaria calcarea]
MSSQTPEPPTNNMGLLISTHTLGPSIIARHNTPAAILDASELSLLRSFCLDPSRKDTVLREHDVVDDQGQGVGIKAQRGVSLAGYVIGRHGTEQPALSEEEDEKAIYLDVPSHEDTIAVAKLVCPDLEGSE